MFGSLISINQRSCPLGGGNSTLGCLSSGGSKVLGDRRPQGDFTRFVAGVLRGHLSKLGATGGLDYVLRGHF